MLMLVLLLLFIQCLFMSNVVVAYKYNKVQQLNMYSSKGVCVKALFTSKIKELPISLHNNP